MSSVSTRRARLEVGKHIEEMMDRLCSRHSVIDAGDWEAFPVEGLCWLRVKRLDDNDDDDAAEIDEANEVHWPAWLLARGTESWSGDTVDRDDFTRVVCCYGSGWTVEVQIFELSPFSSRSPSPSRGGRLYRAALAEAESRAKLASNPEELANFESLISQNMDFCQSPVLLGRVWRAHESRAERRPRPGEMIAVRWNDEDWWPATVDRVGAAVAGVKGEVPPDAVEVVYDDDANSRETIIRGSAVWNADVRCLGDDEQPLHDDDDVKLLDGTEFMLEEEEEEAATEQQRQQAGEKKKQKTILIDALEEDDPEVLAHDDEDEFEPNALKDDAGEDEEDDDDDGVEEEEDVAKDDEEYREGRRPAKRMKKALPAPRIRKRPSAPAPAKKSVVVAAAPKKSKRVSHSQRRQLIKAAASRWSVSSRLVNGGGVALAASRRAPKSHNPEMNGFIVDDDAVDDEEPAVEEEKKKIVPKKISTMRTARPPAATPSVLSLLLGGGAAPSDKSSKTPPTAGSVAKKNDSEAAIDAVELAIASSRKREARLLTMTTPGDLVVQAPAPAEAAAAAPKPPSPSPQRTTALPAPVVQQPILTKQPPVAAAADPVPPPLSEEPKKASSSSSSSKLPPGWVAKWSERKQMYYYAHKAKRLTRWTPPKPGDEAASTAAADATKQNFESSLTDEPINAQTPGALDAARRTMAALEASMHGPPQPAAPPVGSAPPVVSRYIPPPTQNLYGETADQAYVARDVGLSEYTPTGGLTPYVPTNNDPQQTMGPPVGQLPPGRPWQPPGRPWQPPPASYNHPRYQQYNNNNNPRPY